MSKFDDARSFHNGRIDGWIVALRTKQLLPKDIVTETARIGTARAKVRDFVTAADGALFKATCPTNVAWHGLAIAIAPIAIEKLYDYFLEQGKSERSNEELIKQLEFLKIPSWDSASAVVVFDWSKENFYTAGDITQQVLFKGSTSVYVNKWALVKRPNELFVTDKEIPAPLSGSYYLYTGPYNSLKNFVSLIPEPSK